MVKKICKNVKYIVISIIIILLCIIEWYNIYIDIYNFNQLEKVNIIYENNIKKTDRFTTLKKFNSIYGTDIEPIRNCYYVSSYNGEEKYIFSFQLESIIYKIIYWDKYYSFPNYSVAKYKICDSLSCFDGNRNEFESLISNPCKD